VSITEQQALALNAQSCIDISLEGHMLYTIAVVLLVAWLLGLVGIYTIGSFVHVLLVAAIVLFVVGLFTRRRVFG
jgi:hypothetical protein